MKYPKRLRTTFAEAWADRQNSDHAPVEFRLFSFEAVESVGEGVPVLRLDTYIVSISMDVLLSGDRKRIAARIKALQPKVSIRQIGRTLGASHQSVGRDIGPSGPLATARSKGGETADGPNGPRALSGEEAANLAEKEAKKRSPLLWIRA